MSESGYHVAISFAGEDREYAESLASELQSFGVRVFYDRYETSKLWGKNLQLYLSEIYGKQSSFVVIFASKNYAKKIWPTHELESALEHALYNKGEDYILPIKLDDTNIPGLQATIAYVPIDVGISKISRMILEKLEARGLIYIPERRESPDAVLESILLENLDKAHELLATDPVGALLQLLRIASEHTRMGQRPHQAVVDTIENVLPVANEIQCFKAHENLQCATISPKRDLIAACGAGPYVSAEGIWLWKLSGDPIFEQVGEYISWDWLEFIHDGSQLVSCTERWGTPWDKPGSSYQTQVWELNGTPTGEMMRGRYVRDALLGPMVIESMGSSGSRIVSLTEPYTTAVIPRQILSSLGSSESFLCAAEGTNVELWDAGGNCIREMKLHIDFAKTFKHPKNNCRIDYLDVLPGGNSFLSRARARTGLENTCSEICFWTMDGQLVADLGRRNDEDELYVITHRDTHRIAIIWGRQLEVYDSEGKRWVHKSGYGVRTATFSNCGTKVIYGTWDGEIGIIDTSGSVIVQDTLRHPGENACVESVCCDLSDQLLVSVDYEGTARVWDLTSMCAKDNLINFHDWRTTIQTACERLRIHHRFQANDANAKGARALCASINSA